jgi:hypothetical protein
MSGPLDRRVDRRGFIARTAALGLAGTTALPVVAEAVPDGREGEAAEVEVSPRPEALADPTELTVAEAATLIRRGRLRPEELLGYAFTQLDSVARLPRRAGELIASAPMARVSHAVALAGFCLSGGTIALYMVWRIIRTPGDF